MNLNKQDVNCCIHTYTRSIGNRKLMFQKRMTNQDYMINKSNIKHYVDFDEE